MDKRDENIANIDKSGENTKKETTTTNIISNFKSNINDYEFSAGANQSDRTEALKCIEIALAVFPESQYDKAERFLLKSLRICESQKAKSFLESVREAKIQNNSTVNLKVENDSNFISNLNDYEFSAGANQSDRTEALKCIEIARAAFPESQYDKAERFLLKSLRICESKKARSFLEIVRKAKVQNNSTLNLKVENDNAHVIHQNDKINEYNKCIKLVSDAIAEGNLVKAEHFLSNAFRINPNADARKRLKEIQDVRTSKPSSDEANTSKKKFVSYVVNAMTDNRISEVRKFCNLELEKQKSEKTRDQIDRQISMPNIKFETNIDKADNIKPISDLDHVFATNMECIEKAQNAIDEGNYQKALRLLKKSHRMYPNAETRDLMKQVEEKISENGEHPDVVLQNFKKNNWKDVNVLPPLPKSKGVVTSEQITAIERVEQANDDYGILGIPKGSSWDEVNKAYRYLMKVLHPDKNKAPGAEEAFMEVLEAKDRLKPKSS